MIAKYVFWTIHAAVCLTVIIVFAELGLTDPVSLLTLSVGVVIVLGLTAICRRAGYDPNRRK